MKTVHCMRSEIATEGGFTLIELLVVLGIISLSLIVALPAFRNINHEPSPDDLARNLAQLALLVRMESINSQRPHAINLDIVTKSIRDDDGKRRIVIPDSVNVELLTGIDLKYTPDKGSILFFPDGSSTGGEISFSKHSGLRVTTKILWLTGIPTVLRRENIVD